MKSSIKPVLTIFFDALKPESLIHMPFLNSFTYKKRMKTILGYSITCHASMYTGVYPDKHHLWFVWKYSPNTSPFKWVNIFKNFTLMNNFPSRYFLRKTTTLFKNNSSFFGIPLIVNLPLKYWPYIDVSENKLWNEPGYIKGVPTIFEILNKYNISYEVIGMKRGASVTSHIVDNYKIDDLKMWTYLFIGDVDGFSHTLRQDSFEAIKKLKKLDKIIEEKYLKFKEKEKDFHFIVFSDHGHIPIKNKINIYNIFNKYGDDLNKYMHIVDANFIRFWIRNRSEAKRIENILNNIKDGFILTDEDMDKYHVQMPDNRYGDIIFYLDAPNIFSKTIWGFSRKQKSMHGYLPDHRNSDGVFISNRKMKNLDYINLVDILPSILTLLEIPIADYVDGQVLWR